MYVFVIWTTTKKTDIVWLLVVKYLTEWVSSAYSLYFFLPSQLKIVGRTKRTNERTNELTKKVVVTKTQCKSTWHNTRRKQTKHQCVIIIIIIVIEFVCIFVPDRLFSISICVCVCVCFAEKDEQISIVFN